MNVAFRDAGDKPLPVLPARRPGSTVIVTVESSLDAAAPAWRQLCAQDAVASPYQSFDWIRLWHRYVTAPAGREPVIVIGKDATGAPLFVWPLVTDQRGPLRLATFFGGKHATLNMAVWRRDAAQAFNAADMRNVLSQVARLRPDLDLIHLHSQPAVWEGLKNPFMTLPHQLASEDNFVLNLSGGEATEQQISGSMRSRLRNKERKLAKLKGYRYLRAKSAEDVDRQLSHFFAQKAGKLHALGIRNAFGQPGVEEFIRAACHEGLESGQPIIELHALECDGDMLALFSGVHDHQRFTSMFNSHTASDNARQSPGLILLQHLIADCVRREFATFDIGPGEARYKTFFCKDIERIYDSTLALSPRGKLAVHGLRAMNWAKGTIKRNPTLWRHAHALRAKWAAGKNTAE